MPRDLAQVGNLAGVRSTRQRRQERRNAVLVLVDREHARAGRREGSGHLRTDRSRRAGDDHALAFKSCSRTPRHGVLHCSNGATMLRKDVAHEWYTATYRIGSGNGSDRLARLYHGAIPRRTQHAHSLD